VAPGEARGHVVYSQDETQHAAGPAAYQITEPDSYPHAAAGVVASARARRIPLGTFGPSDGLAHEPRRHGVQLACVVVPGRSGGPEASTIRLAGFVSLVQSVRL
jgi:hypothetical protein